MGYFNGKPVPPEVVAMEKDFSMELNRELEGVEDLNRNLCLKGSCGKISKLSLQDQQKSFVDANVPRGTSLEEGKRYTIDANGIRELLPNEIPLSSPIFSVDPSNPKKLIQEKKSVVKMSHGGKKEESEKDIKSLASIIKKPRSKGSKREISTSKDGGRVKNSRVQHRRRKRKSNSN